MRDPLSILRNMQELEKPGYNLTHWVIENNDNIMFAPTSATMTQLVKTYDSLTLFYRLQDYTSVHTMMSNVRCLLSQKWHANEEVSKIMEDPTAHDAVIAISGAMALEISISNAEFTHYLREDREFDYIHNMNLIIDAIGTTYKWYLEYMTQRVR